MVFNGKEGGRREAEGRRQHAIIFFGRDSTVFIGTHFEKAVAAGEGARFALDSSISLNDGSR